MSEEYCPVCGHETHAPNECEGHGVVPGCICFCCIGACTCDGKSWEYDDYWGVQEKKPSGGRWVDPDRKPR